MPGLRIIPLNLNQGLNHLSKLYPNYQSRDSDRQNMFKFYSLVIRGGVDQGQNKRSKAVPIPGPAPLQTDI